MNCPGFQAGGLKALFSFPRPTGVVDKCGMRAMAGIGYWLLKYFMLNGLETRCPFKTFHPQIYTD
jgi:hypothetical protein